jgi:hypothetical protein
MLLVTLTSWDVRRLRKSAPGAVEHLRDVVRRAPPPGLSNDGFSDVLAPGRVVLSGIGFIGGGIIFVRLDGVLGVSTQGDRAE